MNNNVYDKITLEEANNADKAFEMLALYEGEVKQSSEYLEYAFEEILAGKKADKTMVLQNINVLIDATSQEDDILNQLIAIVFTTFVHLQAVVV